MKIIFISGVKFGHEILTHILKHGHKISLVFSYDDSKKEIYSDYVSFDDVTKKYGVQNIKVNKINDIKNFRLIKNVKPDLILVMGWSQLIDEKILELPVIGTIGSHPTELPKYRGRAPIPWSILKNLKKSALTFFWIDKGTDSGDLLNQKFFEIHKNDDASTLYKKITKLGKQMLLKNLQKLEKGIITRIPQDESKFIEYWEKRTPDDGKIDWKKSAKEIHLLIRATTYPYPGAFTIFKDHKLIIWKAKLSSLQGTSGKIFQIGRNIMVGTKKGSISIQKARFGSQDLPISQIFKKSDEGTIL